MRLLRTGAGAFCAAGCGKQWRWGGLSTCSESHEWNQHPSGARCGRYNGASIYPQDWLKSTLFNIPHSETAAAEEEITI